MTALEDKNVRKTFDILEAAKTDNEKFAALLLFAKTTNAKDLSYEERRRALNAVGVTFLNRLLKSKNVPEDCPDTIYKGLALKILSGLCGDARLVIEFEVYKILRNINDIITDPDSENEMIEDCMDILTFLAQTEEGCIKLVDYGTVTASVTVITQQLYGAERCHSVLQSVLYYCGEYAWKKNTPSINTLVEHFSKQLDSFQDERKIDLCGVVSSFISCLPKEMGSKAIERPWFQLLIHAMNDIFTSKLGQPQRDPALQLASVVLDRLGVDCILPPQRPDCKLLLVIIHLSCIEVRIILENLTQEQISEKADTLVCCYNILEVIIGYMTTAPSLKLDENQVLQLHSAMEGAFNSVIFFLREQSDIKEQTENPNQIVLASVRVLGSWLAEETSALKVKVQEILPFLVKLCKCQINHLQKPSSDKNKLKKGVKFKDDHMTKQQDNLVTQLNSCSIDTEIDTKIDQRESSTQSDDKKDSDQSNSQDNISINCDVCGKCENSSGESQTCSCKNTDMKDSGSVRKTMDERINDLCSKTIDQSDTTDIRIQNVDLIRFLLPGLCHMTADDSSRQILVANDIQSCLAVYFMYCVDVLETGNIEEDVLKSMETLCGVFLNIVVLDPELIAENKDFHKVTKQIFRCAGILDKEENLTLWANIMTLGVFFLRQQAHVKYEKDDLTKFFTLVVSFIKAPYTSLVTNNVEVLTVNEIYLPVWDSIYQLWYLCVQATTTCLPLYPSLVYAMMSTGFLPHIIRLLNKVQGRNLDEDTLLCLIGIITSLVTTEPKACDVLKSCGGVEFSRTYNCSELRKLISD